MKNSQSLKKNSYVGTLLKWALKNAQKNRFWPAQAQEWAEPKSFWVVPGGGLVVYKSTPQFGYPGSQGAVRTHF